MHQVFAGRVDAECKRRWSIGDQVDPQDLGGQKRQDNGAALRLQADAVRKQYTEEHRQHLTDIRRQQVAQELSDVREDRAALFDRRDNRCEVVVGEHHVGRLL